MLRFTLIDQQSPTRDAMFSAHGGEFREKVMGDRALPMAEAVVADRERTLGHQHPDTLVSRHNLAKACYSTGDVVRATALYESTLTDRTRVFGSEHPETLICAVEFAGLLARAGKLERSHSLLTTALTSFE